VSRTLGAVSSEKTKLPEVTTTFGVSGYLRESDVLIWDRASQSLWSQISSEAIAGPRAGQRLTSHPVVDSSWGAWKASHPFSRVLRGPKPVRAYAGGYAGYHATDRIMFPVSRSSKRLKNKAIVTGVSVGEAAACWSHAQLKEKAADRPEKERDAALVFTEKVGDTELRLTFDPVGDSLAAARVTKDDVTDLSVMRLYWFAWYAFHPGTTVDGKPIGD